MEFGLAVGGAFLSSALNVLFDRLAPRGELLKMFQRGKHDVRLLKRLKMTLVDESDIFRRQNEIETLVDHLLSVDADGKKYRVITIVGMAGLGKTTLAKAVYNNEKVQDHFDLKAWFCVSEPYDASRITKGLLQEIGSSNLMVNNNLKIQIKLKESLKGKNFLIVLDGVWNDKYIEWDDLRNPFAQGERGSKIIVTTRKESVAEMMGSRPILLAFIQKTCI